MKLVFNKTGDELQLTPVNHKLFEYYVDNLNQQDKNKFFANYTGINTALPERLCDIYSEINKILDKFKLAFPWEVIDPLDQNILNQLHSHWVMLGVKQPKLLSALRLMGEETVQKFRDVNELIHEIENMFHVNSKNFTSDPWMIPNTFGTDILSFDLVNISIVYNNLGRQQYERFRAWDLTWEGRDEMTTLSGELDINLSRPESRVATTEFTNWCQQQNEKPIGVICPLANFTDLEKNLSKYREMFLNNFYDNFKQSNYFFLTV